MLSHVPPAILRTAKPRTRSANDCERAARTTKPPPPRLPPRMPTLDIIIVGAGPTGIAVAIAAQDAGLSHLVIERGPLANSLYHFPVNMTFFSTSEKLEVGGVPFISHADKPSRTEALEYYRRLVDSKGLDLKTYTPVKHVTPEGDAYRVETERGDVYRARNVVLATGYYGVPRTLDVPGEDLPKVRHYYDDPHLYIGQRVLVVGAANSACDVALETWMKGAEVTMVIRGDRIYDRVKYWIKPNIENRIAEGSIEAYFESNVREITPDEVIIDTPTGEVRVPNDFVLAMTGYQPDFDFLAACGVRFDEADERRPFIDAETCAVDGQPGMYVAGVIQAGLATSKLFIENTRHHGKAIVGDILARGAAEAASATVVSAERVAEELATAQ